MVRIKQIMVKHYLFLLQAEARLAAKRAARAEAREIRMKELERQQKEVKSDLYRIISSVLCLQHCMSISILFI